MKKEDFRTISEDARFIIRKKAIRLINSGIKKIVVAQSLEVRPTTISSWVKLYKEGGYQALKSQKCGVKEGSNASLTSDQQKEIQLKIIDKMPDQLKLNFALWTRKAVAELIERDYHIKMPVTTMGTYLRGWGFTPQKPSKKAYEQKPEAVKKWMDEEYPQIKTDAKSEDAEIHWGDETGVKNSCNHGRSYAPIGKTPIKLSMSKRFSINMISSLTNQGKVQFMIYSENMKSDILITFMEQLIKSSPKKIYLILDNLRVHHSKIVKEWLVINSSKIKVFYLPAYSPDRNPDEYLNCDLKQGLSNKPSPKNQESLKENLESHMNMLCENPARIVKYFKHELIKYAAA